MGKLVTATAGLRGFDCNCVVSQDAAQTMVGLGYSFVARYIDRESQKPHHLTAAEVEDLHLSGLAVTAVQHVESESSWVPSGDKGTLYGCNAGMFATQAGIPKGAVVWCDLEGVAASEEVDSAAVMEYCRAWCKGIAAAGFLPGLYVGWHCGLNPSQLYALPFQHYWAAYNLNTDQEPVRRGCEMWQHEAKPGDDPLHLGIDTDTIEGDKLGGFPILYAPDSWEQ